MSFPPAALWHRLHRCNGTPFYPPTCPLYHSSLAQLAVVTSQLLLAGILATNAPTNPVYMATRRQPARWTRKSRLDSGCRTKKHKVFFSLPHSSFVAGGNGGGSSLGPGGGGGQGGPKVCSLSLWAGATASKGRGPPPSYLATVAPIGAVAFAAASHCSTHCVPVSCS